MLIRRGWIVLLLITLAGGTAFAKKRKRSAESRLGGQIILSTTPFPASFTSDAAMVRYMKAQKKKHNNVFRYNAEGKLSLELMAFFKKAHTTTEFTAHIYDISEGRRFIESQSIYPTQRSTSVLNSFIRLNRDTFEAQRNYRIVISKGLRGYVIAEADFGLLPPKGEKKAVVKPTVIDMR